MSDSVDEYWRRHGLTADPFPAEREEWFTDEELDRRLDLLNYLIQSGDQMVLLRGERGSGKSALVSRFLARAGERFVVCLVRAGEGFNSVRLLVSLSQAFADELTGGDSEDLGERLETIQRNGGTPLLVVDDVERLSGEALDTALELYERMGESGRLLRILLVGGAGAEAALGEHPRFRKYREELRAFDLSPLVERQVEAYLGWAVSAAGGTAERLFSAAQRRSIIEESGGLPGRINDLARRLLGGGPVITATEGGAMNLSKLRELDIKKVLAWSGVALLLLAILIFQGRINEMIQGDAAMPLVEEKPEPEPVAIVRRPGEMPRGTLPDRVVREPASPPAPSPASPPAEERAPPKEMAKPDPAPPRESASSAEPSAPASMEAGATGATEATEAEAPVESPMVAGAAATAGDPLAGAPLEHRIPHLEQPTPFKPVDPVAEVPAPPRPPSTDAPESPAKMGEQPVAPKPMVAMDGGGERAIPERSPPKSPPSGKDKGEPSAPSPTTSSAVAAEPASPLKAPVESAPMKMKGEAWLLEQPSGHIALQVLGGADRQALVDFAERHGLLESGAIFHGDNHGRSWYGLLSGIYPDLAAARRALEALPRLSPGYTPWIRSVASVQKEIEKAR